MVSETENSHENVLSKPVPTELLDGFKSRGNEEEIHYTGRSLLVEMISSRVLLLVTVLIAAVLARSVVPCSEEDVAQRCHSQDQLAELKGLTTEIKATSAKTAREEDKKRNLKASNEFCRLIKLGLPCIKKQWDQCPATVTSILRVLREIHSETLEDKKSYPECIDLFPVANPEKQKTETPQPSSTAASRVPCSEKDIGQRCYSQDKLAEWNVLKTEIHAMTGREEDQKRNTTILNEFCRLTKLGVPCIKKQWARCPATINNVLREFRHVQSAALNHKELYPECIDLLPVDNPKV